jgi:hypothetical protein
VPPAVGANGSDVYEPLPDTGVVDVKIGVPAQVRLLGPKSLNVIVPVGPAGPAPRASVAVSVIVPASDRSDAEVFSVGDCLPTWTCSAGSAHDVVTAVLLPSPLYRAIQRYVPAALVVNESDV